MYTAIIAEDSKPILRNIEALMQSMELPVRIAATASNGLDALEYIKANPVDILLTDIRMPKLDGLALIGQCRQVNPALKAVLISGYSDFEYTRKALNLQVFDYLLKPVERQQLAEVMQRLVAHLQEQEGSRKGLPEVLAASEQRPKSSEELFRQLEQYLQQHLYSQLSITEVALQFHVSPSYVSRIFKRHSQRTFVHYYMQLKITEACRLIAAKPELKVKELSELLAFADQHYFSKVFKEYMGVSPSEYKEGQRSGGLV
ncbi:response regulator transcription factor [Paenibacillus silagei]|uniref:YesN/AraC family two-component response regulator n=1 Tax=Paenibacillus silagei TaxID=1670801 RepID=A0ABS4NQA2_9BACL|nr:response regulator [Paenibacillus silagei]MBP2111580.1 YesN/AraC family two-component response regulator [Paenibacillus silagei]